MAYDFNKEFFGAPTAEEAKEAEMALGFQAGVIAVQTILERIAAEMPDVSPMFLEGLFLGIREEI